MSKNRKFLIQKKADLMQKAQTLLDEAGSAGSKAEKAQKLKEYDAVISEVEEMRHDLEVAEREAEFERNMPSLHQGSYNPSPENSFESFGEQLVAVARAADRNAMSDPRLQYNAATGLGESVSSEGGWLVQQDFSNELLNQVHETGMLSRRCRRIPISSGANGIKIPAVDETSRVDGSRWGGVQAYWKAEAAAATASKPKFRQMELNLKKLIGLAYVTEELLADAAALEMVVRQAFTEEFGFKIDDAIVRGDGAGKPMGILNSPALVTVSKESGQAASTVIAENIEKMYARMPASSLMRAEWYINQEVWPQLFQLSHAVGTGGVPVFVPAGGLSAAPFGTLFGRPITPIEQCEALGTAGDIIFADLNQYVLIEKGGIRADLSIHVQFLTDEMTFRFVLRQDGQPIQNAPITPFKGTNTLSPFINLQTRS